MVHLLVGAFQVAHYIIIKGDFEILRNIEILIFIFILIDSNPYRLVLLSAKRSECIQYSAVQDLEKKITSLQWVDPGIARVEGVRGQDTLLYRTVRYGVPQPQDTVYSYLVIVIAAPFCCLHLSPILRYHIQHIPSSKRVHILFHRVVPHSLFSPFHYILI